MRPNIRQMPDGFAEDARTMTVLQMMRKYHCGNAVLYRWLAELDIHRGRGLHKRPVAQLNLETGETIKTYPSVAAAAKAVYGSGQNLIQCCKGKTKYAYGYGWRYCEME